MSLPMQQHPLRLPLAGALAFALTFAAGGAQAQDRTAEVLYQEGKAAAKNKDWPVACAKFKESHAREPAPGTLLNLGDCEENRGQFTQAIADFETAARLCKPGDERADYARQRSFALEKRAPKLTLRLHASTPAGTTVERDGVAVLPLQIGAPILVDPGEHTLVVRAPGRAEMRGAVRLVEAETREIELTAGMPITAGTSTPRDDKAAPRGEAPGATNDGSLKTAAYVSLGVGAVGLGVGIVGGLLTMGAKSTADQHCPAQGCDADGLSAESRGKTWSAVSTVGFVVGGLGLATGAGLLLFAPKSARSTTGTGTGGLSLGPTAGGAQVRWVGAF